MYETDLSILVFVIDRLELNKLGVVQVGRGRLDDASFLRAGGHGSEEV